MLWNRSGISSIALPRIQRRILADIEAAEWPGTGQGGRGKAHVAAYPGPEPAIEQWLCQVPEKLILERVRDYATTAGGGNR
ncbi:hypothetical protein GCM10018965_005180 [Nonomuraea roseola]